MVFHESKGKRFQEEGSGHLMTRCRELTLKWRNVWHLPLDLAT